MKLPVKEAYEPTAAATRPTTCAFCWNQINGHLLPAHLSGPTGQCKKL